MRYDKCVPVFNFDPKWAKTKSGYLSGWRPLMAGRLVVGYERFCKRSYAAEHQPAAKIWMNHLGEDPDYKIANGDDIRFAVWDLEDNMRGSFGNCAFKPTVSIERFPSFLDIYWQDSSGIERHREAIRPENTPWADYSVIQFRGLSNAYKIAQRSPEELEQCWRAIMGWCDEELALIHKQ